MGFRYGKLEYESQIAQIVMINASKNFLQKRKQIFVEKYLNYYYSVANNFLLKQLNALILIFTTLYVNYTAKIRNKSTFVMVKTCQRTRCDSAVIYFYKENFKFVALELTTVYFNKYSINRSTHLCMRDKVYMGIFVYTYT